MTDQPSCVGNTSVQDECEVPSASDSARVQEVCGVRVGATAGAFCAVSAASFGSAAVVPPSNSIGARTHHLGEAGSTSVDSAVQWEMSKENGLLTFKLTV